MEERWAELEARLAALEAEPLSWRPNLDQKPVESIRMKRQREILAVWARRQVESFTAEDAFRQLEKAGFGMKEILAWLEELRYEGRLAGKRRPSPNGNGYVYWKTPTL